jgi:predicted DCC family thiol-disulfide oxidoreductase YuxK
MPPKPLVIFDGHCGFCRIWIDYWQQVTGSWVDYAPSQEVGKEYPQIPLGKYGQSVQLVMPEGRVLEGAQAVFTTLTYAPGMAWLLWMYDHLLGFAALTEASYRFVARNRSFFYSVTRFAFGRRISVLRYSRVEWLFLRLLAGIYLIAFASLAVQINGLAGARGILPLGRYLSAAQQTFGAQAYWLAPTIFWFAHSDAFLVAACVAGIVISLVLLLGYFERLSLICLYLLYLSLSTAGQDFLSFQWDILLLETGFLAIFLGSSKIVVLLFRWLLFRLMFLSGLVKLMSHDPAWRNLTAMSFHYLTQPLPTPPAWYIYQLPLGFHRLSTAMVFAIELTVPFLFFAPRPWRFFGGFCALLLQSLIFLTGNYTFFNLLTMALCVFLFDDEALARLPLRSRTKRTSRFAVATIAAVILTMSSLELWEMLFSRSPEPDPLVRLAAPFDIVNTYGLFAVMTTTRPEIVVQGSDDGVAWLDYKFPFKPGDVRNPPRWVAPYQPRLDWQMWFAALSNYQGTPWFGNFMVRLLQGSPEVLAILAENPFPSAPPKYVRAQLFDYSFTDFATRRTTGDWWKRKPRGLYFPAISLEDVRTTP